MLLAIIAVVSCKEAKKEADKVDGEMDTEMEKVAEELTTNRISMLMEPKSDSNVSGEVSFVEKDGIVTMNAMFSGLTEGEHAIHIHQTADCTAADGSSTGGHWNPTNEPHGKWGDAKGYHKGISVILLQDLMEKVWLNFRLTNGVLAVMMKTKI